MSGEFNLSTKNIFRHRIILDFNSAKISRRKASEVLSVSERTISRLAKAVADRGLKGVIHMNKGKTAVNKKRISCNFIFFYILNI